MATTSQRISALETDVKSLKAWKTAHLENHVKSGHGHPDDATDTDVAALDVRIDVLEGDPAEPPPPVTPPPVTPPPIGANVPIGKFVEAVTTAKTGSTLLLAPGNHNIPTGPHRLRAADVTIVGPATIKPTGRPNGLFIEASGSITRNLTFDSDPGSYTDGNGSALVEINAPNAAGAVVRDTLIEDVALRLPAGGHTSQHGLYMNGSIERLTVRRVASNGNGGNAAGLHGYHNGPTPCQDIVIEDWVFTDHFDAVIIWLNIAKLTLRRCIFVGTRSMDIRLSLGGGTAVIEGCKGRKGIVLDTYNGATNLVESGNNWNWVG